MSNRLLLFSFLYIGTVVMIFNNYNQKNKTKYGRTPLNVALSDDGGLTWPYIRPLQITNDGQKEGPHVEFSYPSVLRTYNDGLIHITYTYDRNTIKYRKITEEWIRQSIDKS
jgi:predicted neuraminidase